MTEKQQTIIRALHGKENPYFQMLRTTAQDKTLSFEARGIIAYLLSKPDNWEINKTNLMKEGDLGRTKMKRLLSELTDSGYMSFEQEKSEDGTFKQVVYTLRECPLAQNVSPVQENREHENRSPVEPLADNDHQHNKESTHKTEETEKDIAPEAQAATPPAKPVQPHIAIIDAFWAGLPGGKPTRATYPRHVKLATLLVEDEITPADVTRFLKAVYDPDTTVFDFKKWHDKPITLEAVADMIKVWKVKNTPRPPLPVQHVPCPQWRIDAGLEDFEEDAA